MHTRYVICLEGVVQNNYMNDLGRLNNQRVTIAERQGFAQGFMSTFFGGVAPILHVGSHAALAGGLLTAASSYFVE